MLLTRFRFIWLIGFRIEDFLEIDLWWPCLLMHRDVISNLYNRPSIDASYKVLVHLPNRFQRRRFLLAHLTKYELLPSLGMGRLLTFHILIFSSKTPLPNELKLGRKYQI
jgi:hypothetical protein